MASAWSGTKAKTMQHRTIAPRGGRGRSSGDRANPSAYAALDLGTNNCRLLIAKPSRAGFSVVGSYSKIVRLGEGLSTTGRLDDRAMARTLDALQICAERLGKWRIAAKRCIATQACRGAANGAEFLARVKTETGLEFSIITPQEEAELSVRGCAALIDTATDAALVVDIGGGSTELSWVDSKTRETHAWTSLPFGVVTIAERYGDDVDQPSVYERIVGDLRTHVAQFRGADSMRDVFTRGRAHAVGTSGAVTSLAAAKLGLERYARARVDGVWMSVEDTRATAKSLREMGRHGRARNGCIGPDRADLVVPGAAILEALFAEWPVARVRVADRGLREGVLMMLMEERSRQ
jgi:exopolyphosphatase/guanosine-5'-triphosphate,3'-diphosphate pyrophosphatase